MLKSILRPVYVPVANFLFLKFKSAKRYHHLFDEIARTKSKNILEVGTWNGNRAAQMISVAQASSQGEVFYYGFDLFESLDDEMYAHELSKKPPTKSEVEARLRESGAAINLIQGNTLETLPEFVKNSGPMDFIFIDGGHSVETVQSDWDSVKQLMHKDTVVIFDDYWRNRPTESAKPVVDAIDTTIYNVEVLPEIDRFNNPDFGRLEISFAKVIKKHAA